MNQHSVIHISSHSCVSTFVWNFSGCCRKWMPVYTSTNRIWKCSFLCILTNTEFYQNLKFLLIRSMKFAVSLLFWVDFLQLLTMLITLLLFVGLLYFFCLWALVILFVHFNCSFPCWFMSFVYKKELGPLSYSLVNYSKNIYWVAIMLHTSEMVQWTKYLKSLLSWNLFIRKR